MTGVHLIGDIGGTHARLALARDGEPHDIRVYPTADITSLEETLTGYLADAKVSGPLARLSIAAAGPLIGAKGAREVVWRPAPWTIREADLREVFACDGIDLMNDFAAQALSLPHLGPADLKRLGEGGTSVEDGTRAVLGPGTGLGVAGLVRGGHRRWIPIVGEGGHVDLAPSSDEEVVIFKILQERYGHVSPERVISGPGLEALYQVLTAVRGETFENRSASDITEIARSGDETARHAIHLLNAWLGAVAGDVALTLGATGGVYISGGVIPALGDLFDAASFRTRFEAKGRFEFYTRAIPTWLVTRDNPALLGLARMGVPR